METKRALIVRLPNWIGDVILALPALEKLAQAGFELHLFGKKWILDLLSTTPYHLYALPRSICATRRRIESCPAKQAVLLTNSFSSAFQFRLSRTQTLGYSTDGRRLLLNHHLAKEPKLHEADHFLKLANAAIELWGPRPASRIETAAHSQTQSTNPRLQFDSAITDKLKERFEKELSSPYWAICPFALGKTKSGEVKVWPHWAELISTLNQRGHQLVVCPGPGETPLCAPYKKEIMQLDGLSLSEYAVVLQGAKQVVANDSGPMHLASAVGAPTLGIFGVTDPARTSPLGGGYIGAADRWPTLSEVLNRLNIQAEEKAHALDAN